MRIQTDYKIIKKHGDMLTPVSIFDKLPGDKKFLLESSFVHETKGKYSFIGANPIQEIIGNDRETTVYHIKDKKEEKYAVGTLNYLQTSFPKVDVEIPFPFYGGAVGYVSYDSVRAFMDIGDPLQDELQMPDIHFMVYDTVIVYEHRTETVHIISFAFDDETEDDLQIQIEAIARRLDEPSTMAYTPESHLQFAPQQSKAQFIEKVEKAQQMMQEENIEQIVLSQRMIANMNGDAFSFYRNLRVANPSPYMFYIDFGAYTIVGASPESLVQTTGRHVITNPIAGTRPRGKTMAEDKAISEELLADEKEIIEHEMLVNLSKADLEKICKASTIDVPIYKQIEKYEHVLHIVSEVHGELLDDITSMDALIACLPAGTVSGSPRERAMQIINEIETEKRGVYAGGIGYIAFNHDINLAIAIRSLIIKDEKAYLQAGAGIVAPSIPEKEYEETLHKARSLTNINNVQQV